MQSAEPRDPIRTLLPDFEAEELVPVAEAEDMPPPAREAEGARPTLHDLDRRGVMPTFSPRRMELKTATKRESVLS